MVELTKMQNVFIGVVSVQNETGITASYWKDLESIKNWKQNLNVLKAQEKKI